MLIHHHACFTKFLYGVCIKFVYNRCKFRFVKSLFATKFKVFDASVQRDCINTVCKIIKIIIHPCKTKIVQKNIVFVIVDFHARWELLKCLLFVE